MQTFNVGAVMEHCLRVLSRNSTALLSMRVWQQMCFHLTESTSYFIRTIVCDCTLASAVLPRYVVLIRNSIIIIMFTVDKNVSASVSFNICSNYVSKHEFLLHEMRNILLFVK